jgi:hypothetical protein
VRGQTGENEQADLICGWRRGGRAGRWCCSAARPRGADGQQEEKGKGPARKEEKGRRISPFNIVT